MSNFQVTSNSPVKSVGFKTLDQSQNETADLENLPPPAAQTSLNQSSISNIVPTSATSKSMFSPAAQKLGGSPAPPMHFSPKPATNFRPPMARAGSFFDYSKGEYVVNDPFNNSQQAIEMAPSVALSGCSKSQFSASFGGLHDIDLSVDLSISSPSPASRRGGLSPQQRIPRAVWGQQ